MSKTKQFDLSDYLNSPEVNTYVSNLEAQQRRARQAALPTSPQQIEHVAGLDSYSNDQLRQIGNDAAAERNTNWATDRWNSVRGGVGQLFSMVGTAMDDPAAAAGATGVAAADAVLSGPLRLASQVSKWAGGDGSLPFDADKGAQFIHESLLPAMQYWGDKLADARNKNDADNTASSAVRGVGQLISDDAQASMSPQAKQRNAQYEATKGFGALGFLATNPAKALDMVLENLPSQLPMLGAGRAAGSLSNIISENAGKAAAAEAMMTPQFRAAMAIGNQKAKDAAMATVQAAAKDAVEAAAAKSAPILTGLNVALEAGTTGAQTTDAIFNAVANAKQEDIAKNPVYQQLLKETGSDAAARNKLAGRLSAEWAPLASFGTAFGSLVTGGAHAEAQALAGHVAGYKEAAKGVGKEMLEEAIQNPLEDAAQYGAERQVNPNAKYDPIKSALEGAVVSMGHSGAVQFAKPVSDSVRGIVGRYQAQTATQPQDQPTQSPVQAGPMPPQVQPADYDPIAPNQDDLLRRMGVQPDPVADAAVASVESALGAGDPTAGLVASVMRGDALQPVHDLAAVRAQQVLQPTTSEGGLFEPKWLPDAAGGEAIDGLSLPKYGVDSQEKQLANIGLDARDAQQRQAIDAHKQASFAAIDAMIARQKAAELEQLHQDSVVPAAIDRAETANQINQALADAAGEGVTAPNAMQLALQAAQQKAMPAKAVTANAVPGNNATLEAAPNISAAAPNIAETAPNILRDDNSRQITPSDAGIDSNASPALTMQQTERGQWLIKGDMAQHAKAIREALPGTKLVVSQQKGQALVQMPSDKNTAKQGQQIRKALDYLLLSGEQLAQRDAQRMAAGERAKAQNRQAQQIDHGSDDILQAVAKLGGINTEQALSEWWRGQPETIGHYNGEIPGNLRRQGVFAFKRQGGLPIDDMIRRLEGEGYLHDGATPNDLLDAIEQRQLHPAGMERQAQEAFEARQQEEAPGEFQQAYHEGEFADDFTKRELEEETDYFELNRQQREAAEAAAEAASLAELDRMIETAPRIASRQGPVTEEELDAIFGPQSRNIATESTQADRGAATGTAAENAGSRIADEKAAPEENGFGLTSYTEGDIQRQEREAGQQRLAEERQRAAADKARQEEETRKEIRRRSEAAADTFTLGGNAEDNLTGQGGLFDAHAGTRHKPINRVSKSDGSGFATRDALRAAATRDGVPQSSLIEKRDEAGNWIGLRHEPDSAIDRIIAEESRAGKVIGSSVRDLHSDDVHTLLMAAGSKKQINAIADYIGKYAPRAAADAVKSRIDSVLKQKGWATEESLYGGGLFDAPTDSKTESSSEQNPAYSAEEVPDMAPNTASNSEMDSLKAEMGDAIGELAALLGVRKNLTAEEESKIIPVMSKIFRIAARMGYVSFKDAARHVMSQIRQIGGDELANKLSIDNLQAGYINIAKEIGGDKREALAYDSIQELEGEPQQSANTPQSDSAQSATDNSAPSLVDKFAGEIANGNMPKDNNALRKMVAAMDGKQPDAFRMKQAQEDLEAAIVVAARSQVDKGQDTKDTFNRLVDLYQSQPNLNIRTSSSIANQAYSTPAPLAYAAAKLAGINESTHVFEPTAGNGMLLLTASPNNATANELDERRFANLQAQGFDAMQGNALDAVTSGAVAEKSQDAVITNPPFGSVKDDAGKATKVVGDEMPVNAEAASGTLNSKANDHASTQGMSAKELQVIIAKALPAHLRERVKVAQSRSNTAQQSARSEDNDLIEAEYDPATGQLTLYADAIPTPERALFVLSHELTHYGLDAKYGFGLSSILLEARNNPMIAKLAAAIAVDRGMAVNSVRQDIADALGVPVARVANSAAARRLQVETANEALAELNAAIERNDFAYLQDRYGVAVPKMMRNDLRGRLSRLAASVKAWLAKLTGKQSTDYSDKQVWDLLAGVRETVRNGGNMAESDGAAQHSMAASSKTINVDGVIRPTTNSNGQPIAQTEEGLRNFWRWFGDSKVVDKDGKPLVVYHGTASTFYAFDPGAVGSNYQSDSKGFFFTSSSAQAEVHATDAEFSFNGNAERNIVPAYLAVQNPAEFETDGNPNAWYDANTDYALNTAEQNGGDGITVAGKDGETLYVAFYPEQIKSAVGNQGTFNGSDPNILRSTAQKQPASAGFSLPEETKPQAAQRQVQDSMNRWQQVLDQVREQGGQVDERNDVYGAEERFHGRAATRIEDFARDEVEPLMQRLADSGHTLKEVEQFLLAQHAAEANARIREIDDSRDTAFGMEDGEAQSILAKFAALPDAAEFNRLANDFRSIADGTLALYEQAGIVSPDAAIAMHRAYQHYVPVKGGDEDQAARQGTGKGLSVNGKQKGRMGHDMRDEHVLENLLRDRQRAIILAEKNNVGTYLLDLIQRNPDPKMWTINVLPKQKVLRNQVSFAVERNGQIVDSFTNIDAAERFIDREVLRGAGQAGDFNILKSSDPYVSMMAKPMMQENEVQVYVKGRPVRIQLHDPILARQYRRMGTEQLGRLVEAGKEMNRWLSQAYTGYNPRFFVKNVARDAIAGTINLTAEQGAGMTAKALMHWPKAGATVFKFVMSGEVPKNEYGRALKRYRAAGGSTGAAYMGDLERQADTLNRLYENYTGALAAVKDGKPGRAVKIATRKLLGGLAHWFEVWNSAGENAFRLATFMAMEESGKTVAQAASMAKNVTVNFNRKGELTPQLGAAYLFLNPSIQGSQRMIKSLFGKDTPHKAQAWALVGGMVGLALALAAMNRGDDEDEWEAIPNSVKDHNMIVPLGKGRKLTIPLPYDYGFFVSMANRLDAVLHGESAEKAAIKLASSFFESFSPVGNPIGEEPDGKNVINVMPTVLKMVLQPAFNINGFGSPMRPDESKADMPDNLKMYLGTRGSAYDKAAQLLSAAHGSPYENNWNDVSPETLKYWVQTLTGGTGKFLADSASLLNVLASGATPEGAEVPIYDTMVRETTVKDARARFYDLGKDAKAQVAAWKRANQAGDSKAASEYESGELLALGQMMDGYRQRATALRDLMAQELQRDDLTLAEKRLKQKTYERQEADIYQEFIRQFKPH